MASFPSLRVIIQTKYRVCYGSFFLDPQGEFSYAPSQKKQVLINEGDYVIVLIEGNGPGGFYTEIARTFVLGEPSLELEEVFGNVLEAQQRTLDMLKPGTHPKDIWDAHNALMDEMGYPPVGRICMPMVRDTIWWKDRPYDMTSP